MLGLAPLAQRFWAYAPGRPLHSAFRSVRSAPLSPTRAATPNAPFRSRLWKFTSERGILITRVMLHARPRPRHEARQPRRSGTEN